MMIWLAEDRDQPPHPLSVALVARPRFERDRTAVPAAAADGTMAACRSTLTCGTASRSRRTSSWEAMTEVGGYRQWWPWLRHFDADVLEAGDRWEAVVQPPLPYRVRFTIHLDEVSPAKHIVARILGDIAGSARVDIV